MVVFQLFQQYPLLVVEVVGVDTHLLIIKQQQMVDLVVEQAVLVEQL
tara:strand:+ start:139 stop:279 length:141 start_codon:yes stop_codon:yes gene_type:complete